MSLSRDGLVLLHNPNCSKSRQTKVLLEERGVSFEVRPYLEQPLSRLELDDLARRLARPVREWVRAGEAAYAEAGLDDDAKDDAILAAIATHPILLERPILVSARRAIVGRPPEQVLALLD